MPAPSPPPLSLQLRFHPRERWFAQGPAYIAEGRITLADGSVFDAVTYQFYFAANGTLGPLAACFPTARAFGYHDHDVERVTVCHDPATGQPARVYFGAHSYPQGTWRAWEDCEKTPDGRLVVYVARNSHAMYPAPGTYLRILGLGNDHCSARGRHLDLTDTAPAPDTVFVPGIALSSGLPWLPPRSYTLKERFFLPWSKNWQ